MAKQESTTPNMWEKIYQERGVVQHEPIQSVAKLAELLVANEKTCPRILDAGCGTGRHIFYLADYFNQGTYVGFDISQTGLDIIRSSWKSTNESKCKLELYELDMDKEISPPLTGLFDAVVSSLVIHHGTTKEIQRRLSNLDSLISMGGYLVLCVPSIYDPLYQTGDEIEPGTKINTDQADGKLPHHYFCPGEIETFLPNYATLFEQVSHPNLVTSRKSGFASKLEFILQKTK